MTKGEKTQGLGKFKTKLRLHREFIESPKLHDNARRRARLSHSVHGCTILHGWAYHRHNRGDCQLFAIRCYTYAIIVIRVEAVRNLSIRLKPSVFSHKKGVYLGLDAFWKVVSLL